MLVTYRSKVILQQCKSLMSFKNTNIKILNLILYNATITCYDRKWSSPPNKCFRLDRKWVDQTASLSLTTIHKTPYTVRMDSLWHTVLKFVFLADFGVLFWPRGVLGGWSMKVRADVKNLTIISYDKLCEIACSQLVVYNAISVYSNILCESMLNICNNAMVPGSSPNLIPRFLSVPYIL